MMIQIEKIPLFFKVFIKKFSAVRVMHGIVSQEEIFQ